MSADCTHGWPARECDRHTRPLARRVLDWAVIATLTALDVTVIALGVAWLYGLIRAAAAIVGGQP